MKGRAAEKIPDPSETMFEDEDLSSARQSEPIPYLAGVRAIGTVFISGISNQYSVEVPADRPGKK
jgi:hypothetical protein